jgi:hypothetical protein
LKTFTIRGWLYACVPIGIVAAVLQRPLRTPEFVNGFLASYWWALWLCYLDHMVVPLSHSTNSGVGESIEFVGLLLGALTQLGLLVVASGTLSAWIAGKTGTG